MASQNILNVVGVLDQIIRDPVTRQRFVEHPDITLREVSDYSPDDVPPQVWNALTRMTFDELKAISDLGFALDEAGLLNGNLPWKHGV
jgi:hypothetical protein